MENTIYQHFDSFDGLMETDLFPLLLSPAVCSLSLRVSVIRVTEDKFIVNMMVFVLSHDGENSLFDLNFTVSRLLRDELFLFLCDEPFGKLSISIK